MGAFLEKPQQEIQKFLFQLSLLKCVYGKEIFKNKIPPTKILGSDKAFKYSLGVAFNQP